MNNKQIKPVFDSKYMKLYDIQYEEDAHYYCASRREMERFPAALEKEDYKTILADAVSCVVVIKVKGEEPKLLLNWEYRYPAGQYLLSVPAGLVDEGEWGNPRALEITAARELLEETGIALEETDDIRIINPFVFSTPGMSDESNALVYIELNRDTMPKMSQGGAVGAEQFNGFKIINKKEAEKYLCDGKDEHGIYYPIYTWAALMFFMGV